MIYATKGKIPDKEWEHDPYLTTAELKETVAMILVKHKVVPPK